MIGKTLSHYQIEEQLGEGGMGQVFRARDTRLDREVAIKVLPPHLSDNPDLRQRFEREARAASSLNHPHICTLYDIGQEEGIDFLVLEYLEGETLAQRLAHGPLPLEELLRCSMQVADALDKAHRQGLTHRDIKPGNIMLTKSGAKLLDFGLAKSREMIAGTPGSTDSPTLSQPLTAEGTIVGTFQYMAPEQLEGQEADARSDIFSFGAVLYEMATGTKAFEGQSQASLIAAIMEREPKPISKLQPMAPPALDRLIKTCLAKDPDERRQTMHDVLLELQWIAEGESQVGLPVPISAKRKSRARLAWALALLLAVSTAALAIAYLPTLFEQPTVVRSFVLPAENSIFHSTGNGGPVAVSPDGLTLAFVATNADGRDQLWIRRLDELAPRPLPGTERSTFPFWSPDSRSLGFFADAKLKKISVGGGPALVLSEAPDGRGGTWNDHGDIIFTPHWRQPLFRVSSAGGTPEQITELDEARQETTHRWPHFLPDGRHFIFLAGTHTGGTSSETNAVYLSQLGSKERRLLVHSRANPVYADGHLLFMRERTLMAQSFDPRSGELNGDAVPVAEDVTYTSGWFRAVFSASQNGVLAYQTGGGSGDLSELVWLDREGEQIGTVGTDPDEYFDPKASPDGGRVAVATLDPSDIWIYESARGVMTRFTFDSSDDWAPIWSPDGSEIVFSSFRKGIGDLYRKVTTGTGQAELLLSTDEFKVASDWSRDGQFIAFVSLSPDNGLNLWTYSFETGEATVFLQSEFNEASARFSPDGKWLAYGSNESGRNEVYVQPFPAMGGKWQLSTNGGNHPFWREDGKELYYVAADNQLMAVDVQAGAGFEAGVPRPLFPTRRKDAEGAQFDVLPDGQRFLLNRPVREETSTPIILIQNWTASLRE